MSATLTVAQREALEYLRRHGAVPESGYWMPSWAMEPPHCPEILPSGVDGRTYAGLARRGLVNRKDATAGKGGAFQLSTEGMNLLTSA